MNHAKQQWGSSFWQSKWWKDILLSSGQALWVEEFSYSWYMILIEYRTLGLGQVGAFSLGVASGCSGTAFLMAWSVIAQRYGAIYWQIEYLDDAPIPLSQRYSTPYKHFLEPYTRVLDLRKNLDTILSEMHEKGRYNIRLAEKRWVTVEWVESTVEHMDSWMWLIAETTDRDGFAHNSRSYYEAFLDQGDTTRMAFAYYAGNVIAAGIFVFHWDTAIYYYGASSSDREVRKHMAPYLLQWHAIEEGKRRGCQIYDLLGIARPWSHDDHLAWVTAFKEKLGGDVLEFGQKILIPLSWKYPLFAFLRKLRK